MSVLTKKEIVDNETEDYTMGKFLNEAISRNIGPISVATGYFNVAGFARVRDNLWKIGNRNDFSFRLLFGKEATSGEENLESFYLTDITESSLINELDGLTIDEQSAKLIDDLISFLRINGVKVRQNRTRFSHAKCYIFDDSVVVGSSNFTRAGLETNLELNAVLYQPSAQELVKEWFERRWEYAGTQKANSSRF